MMKSFLLFIEKYKRYATERPRGSWLKSIVIATMLGTATIFGFNATAQIATHVGGVEQSKGTYVFRDLAQTFSIDEGSKKLQVAPVNTKGDTVGYNSIRVNIYDYFDEKTTKWWVAGVTGSDDGLREWVALAKLGDNEAKPLRIYDSKVVKYVKSLLNDARNLTGAEVATKSVKSIK